MKMTRTRTASMGLALLLVAGSAYAGKPLKVFIMAGQSNMQGKARVFTIERLKLTDDSKPMYHDMVGEDGKPVKVKDVYSVYFTEGRSGSEVTQGQLGPSEHPQAGFGPDYPFGIYMQKYLDEPFLIIKTAWGGKDLIQKFRPPSAGEYPLSQRKIEKAKERGNLEEALAENKAKTGRYYRLMVEHVETVLNDLGKYHPGYNAADGYEIAGFVWFQGWNDLVGPYLRKGKSKDYSEYSRLMAMFIRDVRKDFKAPDMPFVIGVLGVDGVKPDDAFRKAQEAPASMPAFKGNVAAIRTGPFWDVELQRLIDKLYNERLKVVLAENPKIKGRTRAIQNAIGRLKGTMPDESILTPEEYAFYKVAISNAPFHYYGSAYTYGKIGKAMADAMAGLKGMKTAE